MRIPLDQLRQLNETALMECYHRCKCVLCITPTVCKFIIALVDVCSLLDVDGCEQRLELTAALLKRLSGDSRALVALIHLRRSEWFERTGCLQCAIDELYEALGQPLVLGSTIARRLMHVYISLKEWHEARYWVSQCATDSADPQLLEDIKRIELSVRTLESNPRALLGFSSTASFDECGFAVDALLQRGGALDPESHKGRDVMFVKRKRELVLEAMKQLRGNKQIA
jgi:hypothetical protein